jgi:hypothetical protein
VNAEQQAGPHLINGEITLDHLKDFTQLMAQASRQEKAELLAPVLKDMRVSKELFTLTSLISPASPFLVKV